MARQKIVAANWKMYGHATSNAVWVEAVLAAQGLPDQAQMMVFPPFPYLAQIQRLSTGGKLLLGAQNLSSHPEGALTGEVSASMLCDVGCHSVLVGHSERRRIFGEDDDVVAAKFSTAQKAGLTPVLCVGETLEERSNGGTYTVIERQLAAVVDSLGVETLGSAVLAYEPVWAIGTGKNASPEQAQAVHQWIRAWVAGRSRSVADTLQILYGGSVKPDNAAAIFAMPDVDGGLVGGGSLKASDFIAIVRSV